MSDPFRHPAVRRLIRLAFEEDLGRGDITTEVTVPPGRVLQGIVSTREEIVVAGLPLAAVLFDVLGAETLIKTYGKEGERAAAGSELLALRGEARVLLSAERVLLNFLQRCCGVATETRRFVDAVAGTGARIVDTRKTIPGWRLLDKYAVRCGGGGNHRFGLDDGILIKDNHIIACGGITAAVHRARQTASHLLRIEVECGTLAEVEEALVAGVEAILLDNMSTEEIGAAVAKIARRALVEASGGMRLDRVREVAKAGVDLISVGALTHSAAAVDLTMDLSSLPLEKRAKLP